MDPQFDIDVDNEYGYDEDFVDEEDVPEDFKCPICLLVCKEAQQTECGHRFCLTCITKVVQGEAGRPSCPMDNIELNKSQIFPDKWAQKEILRMAVRCRNRAQGCEWEGPLGSLNKHLDEECDRTWVDCPSNCKERLLRANIAEHVDKLCMNRILSCPDCGQKIVFKMMDSHPDQCPAKMVPCPNSCGNVPREKLSEHLEKSCPKSVLSCRFKEFGCRYECSRDAMSEHTRCEQETHIEMVANIIATLRTTCHRLEFEAKQNIPEQMKLNNRMLQLQQSVDSLNKSDVADLKQKLLELEAKTEENRKTVDDIRSKMFNGCVFWRIEKFAKLFQEAKDLTTPAINSFSFYSTTPGYKMYIRVNLNGVDDGTGTHVSMFVHMMRGDFDNIVAWPFCGTVTLTVVDQVNNTQHLVEVLRPKPTVQAFQRPAHARNNKGYGYAKMFPHVHLTERGFLKDDCLLVKVDVHHPPQTTTTT